MYVNKLCKQSNNKLFTCPVDPLSSIYALRLPCPPGSFHSESSLLLICWFSHSSGFSMLLFFLLCPLVVCNRDVMLPLSSKVAKQGQVPVSLNLLSRSRSLDQNSVSLLFSHDSVLPPVYSKDIFKTIVKTVFVISFGRTEFMA